MSGRPTGVTTVNNLPSPVALTSFPSFAWFSESTSYNSDDLVTTTSASFADWSGKILSNVSYNADGAVQSQQFGDAAGTTAQYTYYNDGALLTYHLSRSAGKNVNGAFINRYLLRPGAPPDNTTTQADLVYLTVTPDLVGNPATVNDSSSAAWPSGANKVSSAYTYYDDYRLRSVTANNGNDAWVSPYLTDPSGTYPVLNAPSTKRRLQNQQFTYDWRGNVTNWQDDALDFPDRSLGSISTGASSGLSVVDQFVAATSFDGRLRAHVFYDGAGNATEVGGPNAVYDYTWDELGRLATARRFDTDGLVHAQESYVYDRNGQRVVTARLQPSTGQTLYTLNVFDTLVLKDVAYQAPAPPYAGMGGVNQTPYGGCGPGNCLPGTNCDFNSYTCQACGGSGQPACTCGGPGQNCCLFDTCPSGLGCFDGTCWACGGGGQAACPSEDGSYQDDRFTANFYLSGGLVHVLSTRGMVPNTNVPNFPTRVHWFLNFPDQLGSGAFIVDYQTGELVERTAYQPYGGTDTDYRPTRWGSFREDVKFTGQWDNAEVGLVYMGARYYSPQLGRFISPDPLSVHDVPRDVNPYAYAYGSPARYTDPFGLSPDCTGSVIDNGEATTVCTDDNGPGGWDVLPAPSLGPPGGANVAWANPNGTDSRWNPNATQPVQAMLLGSESPLSFDDSNPPLAQFLRRGGMFVVGGMPVLGTGLAFSVLFDSNASRFSRVLALVGVVASVIPVAGAIARDTAAAAEGVSEGTSALEQASNTAFKAADQVDKFGVPLKHLPGAGGGWSRFGPGVDIQASIREALQSGGARFLPNSQPASFRVVTDLGRVIGEQGQTGIRIVVGADGNIWTAFPVNP